MSMELIEPTKLKTQICNLTAEYDTEAVHIDALIDLIDNQPTVKAIPKADYEARLKADMVAMLTEIQLEIEENSYSENVYGDEYGIDKVISTDGICQIIQQKIDKLKEVEQ